MPQSARETALLDLLLHELRTPLSIASGSLSQAIPEDVSAGQRNAAERLARALDRLALIADELRAWTRAAGESAAPMPLAALIEHSALPELVDPARVLLLDVASPPSDVLVMAGPTTRSALQAAMRAVLRGALDGVTVPVAFRTTADAARIAIGDIDADGPVGEFSAEFSGGLGFSLPLARAVIEAVGGRIWSRMVDGRVAGIAVELRREGY
jgi:signal transduction histidine kinase